MRGSDSLGEEFVRLALAIDEHLPGYVDSYFGPESWKEEAKDAGKVPLEDLARRAALLADGISQTGDLDGQRKDFLSRQVTAMQMSLRLLCGDKISLAEEVQAVYDVQPAWKDEANFEESHKALDQALPPGSSLRERLEQWKKSLEISLDKVKALLPYVTNTLRERTRKKFDLPEQESFIVEFVTDQPWMAYNWYQGEFRSRIEINLDEPLRIIDLPVLIAHEAYPGHHTELVCKEQRLVREMNYVEHLLTLINSPSCVIAEGIATSALETLFTDSELEDWYREDLLPRAGLTQADPQRILEVGHAIKRGNGLWGNAVFMLYDQKKPMEEIKSYLQKYGPHTEKEADHAIRFISDPLGGSYTFTYHIGYDLLAELFSQADRDTYFARLLQEPVTPSQVRQWIDSESRRA